ncbi:CdaR family transcriptional regulator [Salipaludibacillus sp. CF4.18]|uniref:CdaR family transcriptional regulator n=1 Tax=Salipaludibacillus sp. CF4.18 TaxID=3373081 RepID=UPI003EE4859D
MKLIPELAKKIINEAKLVLKENIIVVDQSGEIIASTDSIRVGSFHEGALIVMQTKMKLYITKSMATTLKGVRPGITLPIMYDNEVIGVIGITGIPEDVEPFAELIRRMTELIIREANYMEKKDWETRGLESFFYEWLYNHDIDEEFISRGQILGVSLNSQYICLLFQVDMKQRENELPQIQANMSSWFETQFPREKEDLFIRWGYGRFILLKSIEGSLSKLDFEIKRWQQYFTKHYEVDLAIGIGKKRVNKAIYPAYQEAEKALKAAIKGNRVIYYDSLLLEIILEDVKERLKIEFSNKVFDSIKHDPELMLTLDHYYHHNLSQKKAADDLHIHINTLRYRLKQIRELSGIDPKSTEGITLFYVAWFFQEGNKHTKNHE